MPSRFMCGFLESHQNIPECLRQENPCLTINSEQDDQQSRDKLSQWVESYDDDRMHAFFMLRLGLAPIPPWIWSQPLPIVAVIEDLHQLWHHHRLLLPRLALAFAQPSDAKVLQ